MNTPVIRRMRKFPARLLAFLCDRRGVAAIEFAFIAPLLILLYFGTVDATNWYMTHRKLVLAGATLADLTTQTATSTTGTDIAKYWQATTDAIIAPLPASSVKVTMRDFRLSGTTSKQKWEYPVATTAGCGVSRDATALQALKNAEMADSNDIVIVEVCTSIEPIALKVFGFGTLTVRYQISMRPRLSKTLDCTSGCKVLY
jgi:Flp pilus assembly protein TadG